MLQSFSMKFDGQLLERGFWLYVWEIQGPHPHSVYVGRTGDTSSPHAQSPFKRIGQHLDPGPNARGNALGRRLREARINHLECTFEMLAIGPIFPEQNTFQDHVPIRDQMAALERAVADLLSHRGYRVLGTHPRPGTPDRDLLQRVTEIIEQRFPDITDKQ